MAFTVEHFHDLTQLLEEHPDWRAELRRLLLPDDVLSLPQVVRELADAQCRTEEKIEALTEAQRRTEERLERLEAAIEQLVEAQRKTDDTVGRMKGRMLELAFERKVHAYLGHLLRRARVVGWDTIEDVVESCLDAEEIHDVLLLDLVVKGRPRMGTEIPEVWLAVEVSTVVDRHDVERAVRRSRLLQKAGCPVVPTVAGEGVTEGGEESARDEKVLLLKDGGVALWEDALAAWTQ